jgi:hypothetical protein
MKPYWSKLRVAPLAFVVVPSRVVCPRSVSHVVEMYPPHWFVIKTWLCLLVCYVLVVCLPARVDPAFSKKIRHNPLKHHIKARSLRKPTPLQMVSRRPVRTHQGSGRMDAEGSQVDRRERLNDEEVNQGEDGGENVVLPPPPRPIELAQVLANQTVLMEAILNTVNRSRP